MRFNVKDKVKLTVPLPYLKTSDNMPMLRPPDLVAIDEIGEIISIKNFSYNKSNNLYYIYIFSKNLKTMKNFLLIFILSLSVNTMNFASFPYLQRLIQLNH